jgi:curved DNA-binding protein CbpA
MYDNTFQAINEGLEILKESKTRECYAEADKVSQNYIHERTSHDNELLQEQKARIEDLKTQSRHSMTSCTKRTTR